MLEMSFSLTKSSLIEARNVENGKEFARAIPAITENTSKISSANTIRFLIAALLTMMCESCGEKGEKIEKGVILPRNPV